MKGVYQCYYDISAEFSPASYVICKCENYTSKKSNKYVPYIVCMGKAENYS